MELYEVDKQDFKNTESNNKNVRLSAVHFKYDLLSKVNLKALPMRYDIDIGNKKAVVNIDKDKKTFDFTCVGFDWQVSLLKDDRIKITGKEFSFENSKETFWYLSRNTLSELKSNPSMGSLQFYFAPVESENNIGESLVAAPFLKNMLCNRPDKPWKDYNALSINWAPYNEGKKRKWVIKIADKQRCKQGGEMYMFPNDAVAYAMPAVISTLISSF